MVQNLKVSSHIKGTCYKVTFESCMHYFAKTRTQTTIKTTFSKAAPKAITYRYMKNLDKNAF